MCWEQPERIQINHQPDATVFQFIILMFIYSLTCFGRSPTRHQELNACSGSLWLDLRIVVLAMLFSCWGRPWTQHGYHHDTRVKPEAATAGIELLMAGGKTPETFWAVNKCQDNKLKNCCIWLVIYLNCMLMHGLTNLKPERRCQIGGISKKVTGSAWTANGPVCIISPEQYIFCFYIHFKMTVVHRLFWHRLWSRTKFCELAPSCGISLRNRLYTPN
jgi:hypothetical protein